MKLPYDIKFLIWIVAADVSLWIISGLGVKWCLG